MAREGEEDALRDVGGVMGVAAEQAEGGGINEIEVTLHERGEGGLGAGLGVAAEERGVIIVGHGGFRD